MSNDWHDELHGQGFLLSLLSLCIKVFLVNILFNTCSVLRLITKCDTACVQTSPLPKKKSEEETSVNRRR